MKSLIIIVSLLVSTEIQLTRGSPYEEKIAPPDVNESLHHLDKAQPESTIQNGLEDSDAKQYKSVQDGESQISYDFNSKNPENESSDLSATPDIVENRVESSLSVDEMKKKAIATRDDAIKNAKLNLENVKEKIETMRENAETERCEAFKKSNEQFKHAESIAALIGKRASKKFEEAKQRYKKEYKDAKSAAETKFTDAAEKYNAAVEAVEEEFEKERSQIIENKRKLENENQEALKKASEEKDDALRLANEKRDQAEEKYRNARRSKRRISRDEREKLDNEYQEEMEKYDEAIELAETVWQNVLDNLGIGNQYKAAEEEALKKMEQAKREAESQFESASEERDKVLKEAKMTKQEAKRLAKAERSKAEDECDEILEKAEKEQSIKSRKIWANWRKTQRQANEELIKANTGFLKANYAAMNEYRKALGMAEEMERKLAKVTNIENNSPEKTTEGKRKKKKEKYSRNAERLRK